MVQLQQANRSAAECLFSEVPVWKAFVRSAVCDGFGHLVADDEHTPTVAVLFYGGIVIYGGDPQSRHARDIVRYFPVQPAILGYSPQWSALVEEAHGAALKKYTRYHLSAKSLDPKVAREITREAPVCQALQPADYPRLESDLKWEHQIYHYRGESDFLQRACCFVVKCEDTVVSGASSFVDSDRYAECQVTTAPEFRRKGYARAVSAAYISRCNELGKEVPWDAANEASVNLGKSLGYRDVTEYTVLELLP